MRLDRYGLSWATRPQEAILGESNIGGPSGRKRAGVDSALADKEVGATSEMAANRVRSP